MYPQGTAITIREKTKTLLKLDGKRIICGFDRQIRAYEVEIDSPSGEGKITVLCDVAELEIADAFSPDADTEAMPYAPSSGIQP